MTKINFVLHRIPGLLRRRGYWKISDKHELVLLKYWGPFEAQQDYDIVRKKNHAKRRSRLYTKGERGLSDDRREMNVNNGKEVLVQ